MLVLQLFQVAAMEATTTRTKKAELQKATGNPMGFREVHASREEKEERRNALCEELGRVSKETSFRCFLLEPTLPLSPAYATDSENYGKDSQATKL
jgi:hypothetical protein